MRSKIKYLLLLLLSVVLCSCGLNPREKKESPAQVKTDETDPVETDEADPVETNKTDSVETAIFKNSEATAKKNRLENDFIRVWESTGDYEWRMENLDGTERQRLTAKTALGKDVNNVLWLTNDWIYYVSCDDSYSNDFAIVRVPFHYDTKPVYDTEKKEVLAELESEYMSTSACMVTDSYMLYIDDDEDMDSVVYQYDFDTKENKVLFKSSATMICLDTASLMPLTMENTFFLLIADDTEAAGLYRISFDTMEKESIYTSEVKDRIMSNMAVIDEHSLYFLTPDKDSEENHAIMKYDGDNGSVSCILNHQEFEKIIDETELLADVEAPYDCDISDIYLGCDRLYITVFTEWVTMKTAKEKPHKGKTEELEYEREILLWSELEDLSQWTMEEKLQNYVLEHSTPMVYNDFDQVYYNTSFTAEKDAEILINALYMDKVFFTIIKNTNEKDVVKDTADIERTYMVYDIKSGEFEETDSDDYRGSWGRMEE